MALDCLSYHATASDNDTTWLVREAVPQSSDFNLYSYKFNDMLFGDSQTLKIVLRMFMDFDLLNKFSIPHKVGFDRNEIVFTLSVQVACRWALSVKKNYRPVKYHNWRHALNVCQTMFTVLKTGKMERFMEELEVLGLLVACLCHDLDHRGTNNSYQTKVEPDKIYFAVNYCNCFFLYSGRFPPGCPLLHGHHGTPPFWPMCDDSLQRRKQYIPGETRL